MCKKEENKKPKRKKRKNLLWRKERAILDSYLNTLEESCSKSCLKKDPYINPAVRDIRFKRAEEIMDTKLTHYEKLYRCYVDYHRSLRTFIAVIFAAILICATVIFCTFGPDFKTETKNEENRNSISLSLQYDTEFPSDLTTIPENRYAGHR